MFRSLIILFIIVNLHAEDLVNLYRNQGIVSVEKVLKEKLKDENYWNSFFKDKDVDYGYYETKKYVLLTQKKEANISLFEIQNDKLKLISQNSVIVGENIGDKYKEGDKKTPLGVYELTEKKSKLDPFYGPFALVTSYPNTFDKALNKNGSGIWIHGMPLNEEREKFTKGCIALDNPQLKELESLIKIDKSILLTSDDSLQKVSKKELSKVFATIFQWKDAWKKSNINKYLSFYSKDFIRFDGMKIDKFSKYKKRVFSKNEKKTIKFKNIDVSPYPNSLNKRMFKVNMDEEYISSTVRFFGKKELYLEIINDEVKILTEG